MEQEQTIIQEVRGPRSPAREYLITFITGALVIGFLWFFQYKWDSRTYEEYIVVTTGVLFLLPVLVILLLMRSSPETFGLAAGSPKLSWRYGAGMILVMLPVLWISSHTEAAMRYYPLFKRYNAQYPLSWSYVLYFELLYGMYLFSWEWFFRGFLLFGLARGMGSWSLVAQAIPFWMLHWGKPLPEFIGSLIAGLVLGFVALRTGSFLTGFLVHFAVAVIYDLMVMAAHTSRGFPVF